MELVYTGHHDVAEVALPFGGAAVVEHGASFDFPDELAEQLLEQPNNWRPAEKAAAKTTRKGVSTDGDS